MNILPKKRWHVRTKDNIARVRKDEAAAREEERIKQDKLKFAESEARVNYLRKYSGVADKQIQDESVEQKEYTADACTSQHVDLFSDYKSHVKTTNKELEKEKKEEQEKYEKKIGYLTYLGQDTNEALRLKSWYEVAPKRLDIESERGEINEKDLKTKRSHDPLTFIKAVIPTEERPNTKRKRSPSPKISMYRECHLKLSKKSKKDRKNHKKSKHKNTKEHKEKSRRKDEDRMQKHIKIEQLRKERLLREATEKSRQDALLAPTKSSKTDATDNHTPKIVQKYNSQFNPELAKQNLN